MAIPNIKEISEDIQIKKVNHPCQQPAPAIKKKKFETENFSIFSLEAIGLGGEGGGQYTLLECIVSGTFVLRCRQSNVR
jgi:hypothetical protein